MPWSWRLIVLQAWNELAFDGRFTGWQGHEGARAILHFSCHMLCQSVTPQTCFRRLSAFRVTGGNKSGGRCDIQAEVMRGFRKFEGG